MKHQSIPLRFSVGRNPAPGYPDPARDLSIGHAVRGLLAREVDRRLNAGGEGPPDPRLAIALEGLLARDIALAESWADMAARLAAQGFEIRPGKGGMTLHRLLPDTRLCRIAELGFADDTLAQRMGGGLPPG